MIYRIFKLLVSWNNYLKLHMCKPITVQKPPILSQLPIQCLVFSKCRVIDLYQTVIPVIVQLLPHALFPVPLRDHSRGAPFALVALGSFRAPFSGWSYRSLASFGSPWALRSHFTGNPYRSLVPLGPISSIEPRHSGDTWDATDRAA